MSQTTARIRRYLEDELGECRDGEVEQRLAELDTLEAAIGESRVEAELDVLAALANETRYRLVRALVAAREELCVCELQPLVGVSESGLSHALSALVEAGLIDGRKDGRWKKYQATNRAIAIVTVLEGTVGDDGPLDGSGDDGTSSEGTADE
ncbi:ArsR/SmtB family transcription factor [Halorhabdus amylolytica]|uniref:ArsR/SmtB family transcription factor n=1 Tax=Halorhabdus amylolytica TaxID=2559573 RepID=UPI0010AA0916|nr:metalloregulator ArsR/SmtB family transcription factor [Halorhabdus amylolytica]